MNHERKKMCYGVCTWIFGEKDLEEIARKLSEFGYDGVELFGDWELYPPKLARRVLSEHGLRVFSLTPKDVDLAHPASKIRKQAIDYYLRLLDFAAFLEAPLVSCHGMSGRIRPISTQQEEEHLFYEAICFLAERARKLGIRLVLEGLNRYESYFLNTASQLRTFVEKIDTSLVGILLDTYHMNIEEADLVNAIYTAGDRLFLFHVADSNRRGIGQGHISFPPLFRALKDVRYSGPIIVECTAPGPDPFTPVKEGNWYEIVLDDVKKSLNELKTLDLCS